MAYSDFKSVEQLSVKFGIKHTYANFLGETPLIQPSIYVLNDLEEALEFPLYNSEKAKSELLIMPLLKEVRRHFKNFIVYSGYNFDVDNAQGLNGFCDYLLSSSEQSVEIHSPVFCLVEAKNKTVEEGFAQVGAEMYAAQIFNEKEGKPTPVVYGCVTDGDTWVFLKLENKHLLTDKARYHFDEANLPKLLGVFVKIALEFLPYSQKS
jgi:hypothetical protein